VFSEGDLSPEDVVTSARDRAETYLRLRAEAELRRVQALPRPDPPANPGLPEPLRGAARLALPFGRRAAAALQPLALSAGRALQPLADSAEEALRPLARGALDAVAPLAENVGRALEPLAGQVIGAVLPAADEAARRLHPLAWQAADRLQGLQRSGEHQFLLWRWQARQATATLCGSGPADAGPEREEPSPEEGAQRLRAIAHALARAGAVDLATADSIVVSLETALAARGRLDPERLLMRELYAEQQRHTARPPAGPYLAAPVGVMFPAGPRSGLADVRLFTLVIAPDRAVLTVSGRLSDENLRSRHLDPWPLFGSNAPPVARDDRGNQYGFHEDGGWSDDEHWGGILVLTPIPPPGVRWLDLTMTPGSAPVRVNLADAGPRDEGVPACVCDGNPAELMIEAAALEMLYLAAGDGQELLWHDLSGLADIVAALDAVGAMEPARDAAGRLVTLARRLGAPVPAALSEAAPPGGPADLPEPWRNLLENRGRRDGPLGLAPAAAVLPELDGARFVLAGLRSDETGADLDVMGWGSRAVLFDSGASLWAWSARDDRGRWHVAEEASSSASDQHANLQLRLVPPLHPDATSLEVTVAGQTGRATATVPLDWRRVNQETP
jgi:hypothetical protein